MEFVLRFFSVVGLSTLQLQLPVRDIHPTAMAYFIHVPVFFISRRSYLSERRIVGFQKQLKAG